MIQRVLPSTLEATVRPKRLAERIHIDPPLLLGLIGIALLGIAVLYSAGSADTDLLKIRQHFARVGPRMTSATQTKLSQIDRFKPILRMDFDR